MAVQYTEMKICLRVLKVDVSASNMRKAQRMAMKQYGREN